MTATDSIAERLPPLDEKCITCDGEGVVTALEWTRYWAAIGLEGAVAPDEPDGPEEIDCGECAGEGRILTAAGRDLLAFLRRHGR